MRSLEDLQKEVTRLEVEVMMTKVEVSMWKDLYHSTQKMELTPGKFFGILASGIGIGACVAWLGFLL